MKLKKLMAFALAAAIPLSLAACGSGGDKNASTSDGNASGSAASGGELKLAIWDTYQEKGITETLKDFTAQTGIKVTVEVTPWEQYWTMLEAAATGSALPDVFWMHSNESARYMGADMLLDLTDKIAASDKLDMSKFPEGLVGIYGMDGKQYGIPKDLDTIGLWYNKTMFDEAGVTYPDDTWTWDTLKESAKKLTNDQQFGFCSQLSANQENWYNFVYQNGGHIISEDKKKSGFDDPKTIGGVEFAVSFIQEKLSPDATTTTENTPIALLESGKVAMTYLGSWTLSELANNEYVVANCDVAPLPSAPDGTRTTIYNGLGWAAAAGTSKPDLAWQLLEFLGSREAQDKLSTLGVAISAYEGAANSWAKSNDKFNLQCYVDQIPYGVMRPYSASTVTWENMSLQKLASVWTLETPVADGCKAVADEMNTILASEG